MILERLQKLRSIGRVCEKNSLNGLDKRHVHQVLRGSRREQNYVKRRCRESLL